MRLDLNAHQLIHGIRGRDSVLILSMPDVVHFVRPASRRCLCVCCKYLRQRSVTRTMRGLHSLWAILLALGLIGGPSLAQAQLSESPITPGFWSFANRKRLRQFRPYWPRHKARVRLSRSCRMMKWRSVIPVFDINHRAIYIFQNCPDIFLYFLYFPFARAFYISRCFQHAPMYARCPLLCQISEILGGYSRRLENELKDLANVCA